MTSHLRFLLVTTLTLLLLLDASNHASVQAVPAGFVNEGVALVAQATGFAFAPKRDGSHMLLVCSKAGILWLVPNSEESNEMKLIMDISDRICTSGERGLQTVAVHPNFVQNRYIYVYYPWPKFGNCGESAETGPVGRVSRFELDAVDYSARMDTEFVLFETSSFYDDIHNLGDMAFGKDGYLYVTTGDGGNRRDRTSQKLDNLLGSVIRLNEDGTIPPDNPFTSRYGYTSTRCFKDGFVPEGYPMDTVCEEIYAYGLRNPFRMAMDPNTANGVVRVLMNDVGGGKWEETNELKRGANYGWPTREGPCSLNSITDCDELSDQYEDPLHWYQHTKSGGAAVGIAVVPNGLWPSEYDDAVIFADFVLGDFFVLEKDPFRECRQCNPPVPGYGIRTFHMVDSPVQLTFGPYKGSQALYYSTRGPGLFNIRRIYFVGGNNNAPVAVISATTTEGKVGMVIQFDGSGSYDPDGDEIDFAWSFGDGTEGTSGRDAVRHTFESPGVFLASLTVKDSHGFADTAYVEVKVGTQPVVKIESPAQGDTFFVGEVITLSGSAEDGYGNALPDKSLSWEVRQHHNTHYQPFLDPTKGNNIVLQGAPAPEDFEASTNSYLEVILSATDFDGVQSSVSRNIYPESALLLFMSEPTAMKLILDDFTVTTPAAVLSWVNHSLRIEAPDQGSWIWSSWSNGGDRNHEVLVPQTDGSSAIIIQANFGLPSTPAPISGLTTAPPTSRPTITIGTAYAEPTVADILITAPTSKPETTSCGEKIVSRFGVLSFTILLLPEVVLFLIY